MSISADTTSFVIGAAKDALYGAAVAPDHWMWSEVGSQNQEVEVR